MSEAQNVRAMRQWIQQCRPDVARSFDDIVDGATGSGQMQAIFGLMCMAFEAGRQHQKYTPDDPNLAPILPHESM